MDYEKLHKDTINKLQQMVSCGKITVEVARGICADFVPESEYEKIRIALVKYLTSSITNPDYEICGIPFKEVLAWLGKQGEKGTNGNEREIPNSTWSEEDEDLLRWTINNLTELEQRFGKYYGKVGECINWIKQRRWKKSLKTADLENSLCNIQDSYSDTSYEYRVLGEAIEFIRTIETI